MSRWAGQGVVRTGRPVGRVLSRVLSAPGATIHLGRPLPAASSGLPACSGGQPSNARASGARLGTGLLDLAPGGVCRAGPVTRTAGGLLHHRFTLTAPAREHGRRSVLCGTVPRVAPGGCWPPPCPVEPGPSSAAPSRRSVTRSPGRPVRRSKRSVTEGPRGGAVATWTDVEDLVADLPGASAGPGSRGKSGLVCRPARVRAAPSRTTPAGRSCRCGAARWTSSGRLRRVVRRSR